MKLDAYTKAVLTLIAVALCVIALGQLSPPRAQASPTGESLKFGDIIYANGGASISFFDKSTGDVWYYGGFGSNEQPQRFKLNKLGEPLQKDTQ